ncbi:hypothetical protein PFAG_03965 [Plasmodium falciparum Santa Lucia]|uniref:Uncharacterized protein n=3 Tax=Plasmodium falciparum TaxID=5833 RepID=W7K6V3_PLAFO|nr:hypothetical protein PFMALIP_03860 [Plasmodium falciparum MaliPS096_E11]EUT82590.1 hypothetical protein PFAG_03965 [Plasmodium falciparum Santa Lucia]EWC89189.1 hypothetical protein PFNF54_02152 [Plasmodium falciparum NF54]
MSQDNSDININDEKNEYNDEDIKEYYNEFKVNMMEGQENETFQNI